MAIEGPPEESSEQEPTIIGPTPGDLIPHGEGHEEEYEKFIANVVESMKTRERAIEEVRPLLEAKRAQLHEIGIREDELLEQHRGSLDAMEEAITNAGSEEEKSKIAEEYDQGRRELKSQLGDFNAQREQIDQEMQDIVENAGLMWKDIRSPEE